MSVNDAVSLFRIGLLVVCGVIFMGLRHERSGTRRALAVMIAGLFVVLAIGAGVRLWANEYANLYATALYTPYIAALLVVLLAVWFGNDKPGRGA